MAEPETTIGYSIGPNWVAAVFREVLNHNGAVEAEERDGMIVVRWQIGEVVTRTMIDLWALRRAKDPFGILESLALQARHNYSDFLRTKVDQPGPSPTGTSMAEQPIQNGIGDAVRQIAQLAQQAQAINLREMKVPAERGGKYLLVKDDGTYESKLAEPDWHSEELDTIPDLRAFAEAHKGDRSALFYSETVAEFIYDLADRRDTCRCTLDISPQYNTLLTSGGKPMDQRAFLRLLRVQLWGCLQSSSLLSIMRRLTFVAGREGTSEIEHGRESIGRNISAKVAGAGDASIPEEVVLTLQPYSNHPCSVSVPCAIELYPDDQQVALTPYPLALTRAVDNVLSNIAGVLADTGIPVYRGRP